jgi:hypothetical protein
MAQQTNEGKITFIHHEKNRAVIEYLDNKKKKTIHASIDEKSQLKSIEQKIIKKPHRYLVGDQVKFVIKKTGANGKVLYADQLEYLYNTNLELLINKAALQNKFLGYIKITGEEYFIKEIDSYLFFPMKIGAYEIAPTEAETSKPVYFKLEQTGNPEKIYASLYNHHYIPEFLQAVQLHKKKSPVTAIVHKITPYGIQLNLFNGKIKAKLAIDDSMEKLIENKSIHPGSELPVIITHLDTNRIVVEKAAG